MRFRAGLIIGFGAGFYVGAMAGRDRYEQINRTLRRAKRSDAFDAAAEKAKAVVDLGVERARDLVETKLTHDSGNANLSDHSDTPDPAGHPADKAGKSPLAAETSKTGNGDTPH
jgi:hypothetical protein